MMANSRPQSAPMRTFAKKLKLNGEARKPKIIVYYCDYCNRGSLKLDIVHAHWQKVHKNEDNFAMFMYYQIAEAQVKCGLRCEWY